MICGSGLRWQRVKMNDTDNKRFYVAITAIVLFAACLPLFTVNCIGGHDIVYHLLRIESLKEAILSGRPFLRINMLFFGGMGYASSLFYPDFLLYFPALLRVFGVGINLSYHLFIAFCIIAGFASSFYCARHISKNNYAAIVTAVIFTLYQYHIDDIYTRSAVGEFTAVIFVPFVIAGLYDLIFEEYKHPWFLFAGMAGVLLCHTITTVICVGLCVLAGLADIRGMIKAPMKLLKLFATAALVLGATAFYWLPVLEMILTGTFSSDFTYDAAFEAAKLWELFDNEYNRMGIVIFLLLFSFFLVKKRQRFATLCVIAGLLITICATGLFPWERISFLLGFIQFPWRLFVVTGPLLAFGEGIYIAELAGELSENNEARFYIPRIILVIVTALMLVSAVSNLERNTEKYYSYSDDYFDYAPFTDHVIGGEWLPVTVDNREELVEQSESAVTDKEEELSVTRNKNELALYAIPADTLYVDVPFVYYKGYAAKDNKTGTELSVTSEGRNGCVRVYTEGSQEIRVYYRGTVLQHVSDWISAGTIAGIAVYLIMAFGRRRKEKA